MGQRADHNRQQSKELPPNDRSSQVERRERIGRRKRGRSEGGFYAWFASERPVLRFVVVLGGLMVGFNACFYLWIAEAGFFRSYLNLYATLSAGFIRVFGDNAVAAGNSIQSPRFSFSVTTGCDAVQVTAFFVCIVLASPSPVTLLARVPYLLVGTLLLSLMNLVRLVSLYYTGAYFPEAFDFMHIDLWQAFLIFLPLVLWFGWVARTMPTGGAASDVRS